jgi:hypothetical protein
MYQRGFPQQHKVYLFVILQSWIERRTSLPPTRKPSLNDHLQLADGRSAERVPSPLRPSSEPTIAFYHNGHLGVLISDILHGKHVQDSQETVAMAGSSTIILQVN